MFHVSLTRRHRRSCLLHAWIIPDRSIIPSMLSPFCPRCPQSVLFHAQGGGQPAGDWLRPRPRDVGLRRPVRRQLVGALLPDRQLLQQGGQRRDVYASCRESQNSCGVGGGILCILGCSRKRIVTLPNRVGSCNIEAPLNMVTYCHSTQ